MSDISRDPTAGFRLDGKVVLVTGARSGLGVLVSLILILPWHIEVSCLDTGYWILDTRC